MVNWEEAEQLDMDLGNIFVTQTHKNHYVELSERT